MRSGSASHKFRLRHYKLINFFLLHTRLHTKAQLHIHLSIDVFSREHVAISAARPAICLFYRLP